MRTFVILLNFLLISLLLYNFLNNTNSIFEGLEGCPSDKKNMVYKQNADLQRLFSELNTVKSEVNALKIGITTNSMLTQLNAKGAQKVSGDITAEKDKKMKELDELVDSGGKSDLAKRWA